MDRGVRRCDRGSPTRDGADEQPRHQEILAFLENEIGLEAMKRGTTREATAAFRAAIDLDAKNVPAYLNLGDVRVDPGRLGRDRQPPGSGSSSTTPERAYLAFARARERYTQLNGAPERFPTLCRRLIDGGAQEWRARLALARYLTSARSA